MELFAKIFNSFQPLTIFAKSSILEFRMSSEYASDLRHEFHDPQIYILRKGGWESNIDPTAALKSRFITQASMICQY